MHRFYFLDAIHSLKREDNFIVDRDRASNETSVSSLRTNCKPEEK